MKKIFFIVGAFLVVTGFTKQEIASNIDKEILNNFKTEITKVAETQQSPWAIFTAIDNNDYAEVKRLLAQGVSPTKRDWANNTPLMWAAKRGYTDICQLLISYFKNPKYIDEVNEFDWTALMFAAQNNHAQTVKLLIEKGANKEHKTISFSETVLGVAAQGGATAAVKVLLEKGVNIEQKGDFGYTPLMYAVDSNHPDTVSFLISKKANVNARDEMGETPLMIAAALGHYKIVQILIANYAKINDKSDENRTPLMYAATGGSYDSVVYMLSDERLEKAKINEQDIYGKTALYYARKNGHIKVAEYLKAKGAK